MNPRALLCTLVVLGLSLSTGCGSEPIEQESQSHDAVQPSDPLPRTGRTASRDSIKADAVCGEYPANYYEFLDDTQCRKRVPTNRDRSLACPVIATIDSVTQSEDEGTATYAPASAPRVFDTELLRAHVPDSIKMSIILIKRVDGVPHYRYLSNGTHDDVVQPWSSTKFMAMANGAAALRSASDGHVGLDAEVSGIPLGDLGTVIHNYDEREYKSNALAAWFHDLGGRNRANALIHDEWLERPETESFGGNYGLRSAPLGYTLLSAQGSLKHEPNLEGRYANQLSTHTMAEFLKRLVMHREDEATRMPGLEWADLEVLFYGAPNSIWFPDGTAQGMESDTAVYLQQAFNVPQMEVRSQGQWRVFSKLGFGITGRGAEFVHNGYACLPALNEEGEIIPNVGKEFIISVFTRSAANEAATMDRHLAQTYTHVVQKILSGEIR